MSLSRLWQRQGKRPEPTKLLAEVYGWFTEGFDTADLQEAGPCSMRSRDGSADPRSVGALPAEKHHAAWLAHEHQQRGRSRSALQAVAGDGRTRGGGCLCQHFQPIHPLHTVKARPTGCHQPQRRPVLRRERRPVETARQ